MKRLFLAMLLIAVAAAAAAGVWTWRHRTLPFVSLSGSSGGGGGGAETRTPTFDRDIAPIVDAHCGECHHSGGAGPFALLTYEDVKKHASQVADVTSRRYMPPWQPEPGYGRFAGERRLSDEQIATIGQWVKAGAPQGNPADRPPIPTFTAGWHLGHPDLVVTLPQPYALQPEGDAGRDVYRNFVIPIHLDAPRYVRAVELHPGNPQCVHHGFAMFDRTRESRRLDEQDAIPGFAGMDSGPGAQSPGGQFLSWQPGKVPVPGDPDTAWRLEPGTDLVIQLHMRPTGKIEMVQPSVGIYFSSTVPTRQAFKLRLASLLIDIPPGAKDYAVEDNYRLPVDVELREVLPHAHYLANDIRGWATLPDGTRKELLWIKHWDFNWQGEYRYAEPIFLPRGTVLSMRMTYDNSADNPRNPNRPPKRVTYGPQTSDEMAELWFQVVPSRREDLAPLARDFAHKRLSLVIERLHHLLSDAPNDADVHFRLGKALMADGRSGEALAELRTAYGLRPDLSDAHDYAGRVLLGAGDLVGATEEFERAVTLDAHSPEPRNNLGLARLRAQNWSGAAECFRAALRLNPDDAVAHLNLGIAVLKLGDPAAAKGEFLTALRLDPELSLARTGLAEAQAAASGSAH